MPLPTPNLDDRTFQSLVDDAKRLVQQRCPEWTDHNVSDPGVTLIETFAYMVDQVLWRLNRVPDRTYVKFLELIGLRLEPPNAARASVTFWLTTDQEAVVQVPAGTEVATPRTEDEPVGFTTLADLNMPPCSVRWVAAETEGNQIDHTESLVGKLRFPCFSAKPKVGDCLYIGLSNAVPSCAVNLRFGCEIAGVGVDPNNPPLIWEAWDGTEWVECELESGADGTGGLNRDGDVVLHMPAGHRAHSGILRQAAGWLRCRLVQPREDQPFYSASPTITRLSGFTIGGTTEAVNAEVVQDELIGTSEGVPAQRFTLSQRPVVPGDRACSYIVDVATADGWEEWTQVPEFSFSRPNDRHFLVEETAGEIVFGPGVREQDGTLRTYGAIPPKGAALRIREYRSGGGRRGNVARGALSVLKSSLPIIDSVTNRTPGGGGSDGEDLENAKVRGPLLLRTQQRAVTAEDYEHLALAAAREVARVRCVPAGVNGGEPGGVRVLLVPNVEDGAHKSLEFSQLLPPDEVFARVADHLDSRRTVGARVMVQSPSYVSISVVASMRAKPRFNVQGLESAALEALYSYLHPLRGGPDGTGWPFGRAVAGGEIYAVLQSVRGVDYVEEVGLYPANPLTQKREPRSERIELGPHDLVFSWQHQVMVEPA